jgi:hypothetical protein
LLDGRCTPENDGIRTEGELQSRVLRVVPAPCAATLGSTPQRVERGAALSTCLRSESRWHDDRRSCAFGTAPRIVADRSAEGIRRARRPLVA